MKAEEFAALRALVARKGWLALPAGAQRDAVILAAVRPHGARPARDTSRWAFGLSFGMHMLAARMGEVVVPVNDWQGRPDPEGRATLTSIVGLSASMVDCLTQVTRFDNGCFSSLAARKATGYAGLNRPDRTVKVPSGSADENPAQGTGVPAPAALTALVVATRGRYAAEVDLETRATAAAETYEAAGARAREQLDRAFAARSSGEQARARRDGQASALVAARAEAVGALAMGQLMQLTRSALPPPGLGEFAPRDHRSAGVGARRRLSRAGNA